MPSLLVKQSDSPPTALRLDRPRISVGRSPQCDIILADPFASRLHAIVQKRGNKLLLVDMGSANGTQCNGEKVVAPRALEVGDVVRIGSATLTVLGNERVSLPPVPVFLSGSERDSLPDTETMVMADEGLVDSLRAGRTTMRKMAAARLDPQPSVDLLELISKVGLVLMSRSSMSDTIRRTMQLVFDAIPCDRGFLFLVEDGEITCRLASTQSGVPPVDAVVSRSIVGRVVNNGALVRSADASEDPRFRKVGSVQIGAIRSVMAVPLTVDHRTFGAIYIDNAISNRFQDHDLIVLGTIAAVAAVKIEHESLRAELTEKRQLDEELKIAAEIQTRLLPLTPPKIPGWDFCGVSLPCRETGGDYFDFIRHDDGKLGIAVGDVSGKGISAALLVSSLHAAVRAHTQSSRVLGEAMTKVNRYIYENAPTNRFVTLFYGELDTDNGVLRYVNGGHNPPILVRKNGDIERLSVGGMAMGIVADEPYPVGIVQLERGDALIAFSDGITESQDQDGAEFGETRLLAAALASSRITASGLRDELDEALSRFVGDAPPVDDMTEVVLVRN